MPNQPPAPGESNLPPRLRCPNRDQRLPQPRCYDDLIAEDHPARAVWELVGRWDLRRFLQEIRVRGSAPGRNATDPRLLIALWLFATIEGIGCGRELGRRCARDAAYQWLCGGVTLNYHTLNDFRVGDVEALDDLLTQMLAVLVEAGIVSVDRLAQDGTRVRASAGSASFHRRETLEERLRSARAHVEAVRQAAADHALSAQRRAARQRAARERQGRLEQALLELQEVARAKAEQKDKPSKARPARASSTDPEARLMRMPDGGTRPAYNFQFSVDCESRAVVAVDATNAGSDVGQDGPLRAQAEERAEAAVAEQLADGDYVSLAVIERAAAEEVTAYMPVPEPRTEGTDRYRPKPADSEAVGQWRQRMGTEAAQEIYKQRGATSETLNGELKAWRGLDRLLVRGLKKARCVGLWSALAYNLFHFASELIAN